MQTAEEVVTPTGEASWLARPEIGAVVAILLVVATAGAAMLSGGEQATPSDADVPAMTIPQVIIISVVEGVTEFLPVSSTGHIILAQRAMGIEQDHAADAFAICIQAGAILAILGLYRQRTQQLARGLLGQDRDGLKLSVNIAIAFVPFMIAALLFYEPIMAMFTLRTSAVMWFVGGLVIFAMAWWQRGKAATAGRTMDDLTWKMALIIGLIQIASVVPGTSRALVAILGGLVVGLSLRAAVEFSFLLGVLTLTAAAVYEGYGNGMVMFETYGLIVPVIGLVVAGLSAAAAVKWMVTYLDRYSMSIFGWYRVALAIGVGALIMFEIIDG